MNPQTELDRKIAEAKKEAKSQKINLTMCITALIALIAVVCFWPDDSVHDKKFDYDNYFTLYTFHKKTIDATMPAASILSVADTFYTEYDDGNVFANRMKPDTGYTEFEPCKHCDGMIQFTGESQTATMNIYTGVIFNVFVTLPLTSLEHSRIPQTIER